MTYNGLHIKRIAAMLLALVLTTGLAAAQNKNRQINTEQRQKVLEDIREFKHNAFAQQLSLSNEQQEEFFKLYDQMDDELMAVNEETRKLERKVRNNDEAADAEVLAAARALYNQKKTEADIEQKYFEKFSDILTPRQMLNLRTVERWIATKIATFAGRIQGRNNKAK